MGATTEKLLNTVIIQNEVGSRSKWRISKSCISKSCISKSCISKSSKMKGAVNTNAYLLHKNKNENCSK